MFCGKRWDSLKNPTSAGRTDEKNPHRCRGYQRKHAVEGGCQSPEVAKSPPDICPKLIEEERLDTLHNHWANVFDDEGTWGESTSMFEDLTKGKPGPTLAGVNTVVL